MADEGTANKPCTAAEGREGRVLREDRCVAAKAETAVEEEEEEAGLSAERDERPPFSLVGAVAGGRCCCFGGCVMQAEA